MHVLCSVCVCSVQWNSCRDRYLLGPPDHRQAHLRRVSGQVREQQGAPPSGLLAVGARPYGASGGSQPIRSGLSHLFDGQPCQVWPLPAHLVVQLPARPQDEQGEEAPALAAGGPGVPALRGGLHLGLPERLARAEGAECAAHAVGDVLVQGGLRHEGLVRLHRPPVQLPDRREVRPEYTSV